jgi:hypothetical protein
MPRGLLGNVGFSSPARLNGTDGHGAVRGGFGAFLKIVRRIGTREPVSARGSLKARKSNGEMKADFYALSGK